MKIITVLGTHAWSGDGDLDWSGPTSPLMTDLAIVGIELLDAEHPFVWTTNLGGHIPFTRRDLVVWRASGVQLLYYVVPPRCPERRVPPGETNLLTHSHGLQPALCAAAEGLLIDTLVDVAGPVRKDMREVAEAARPNIRRWIHIHAGRRDKMQWLGELFDGHLGIVREHPLANENIAVPEADHGDVLRTPRYFPIVARAFLREEFQ